MVRSALDHVPEIAGGADQLAIFLDYDGTLTPIVRQPEEAILSDSTRSVLKTLAARTPVAILSGRELEDMQRRVNIDGIVYAGSHGFDIAGPRGIRKQVAPEFLPILDAAEKELKEKLAGIDGALVERKRFAIAAHYRQVADENVPQVAQAVNEVAAHHCELRKITGKKVYELQPNIDWDKGKALLWLLEVMGSKEQKIFSVYIGDDLTDEDAFRVLQQPGVGIIVTEQPRPSAARYMLKDPAEVELFLRDLTARMAALGDS
jgi:trehalose 6-phosphate phosphatase